MFKPVNKCFSEEANYYNLQQFFNLNSWELVSTWKRRKHDFCQYVRFMWLASGPKRSENIDLFFSS